MDIDFIEGGVDFAEAIKSGLDSCAVLVALIGAKWLTVTDDDGRRRLDNPGDYVRYEIRTALKRGVRVIPVLVDGATAPQPKQLPGDLQKLARLNALEMSYTRLDYDATRLVDVIRRVLEAEAGDPAGQDGSPVPPTGAEMRYSLPPDTAAFTGREQELDRISAAVSGATGTGSVVAVGAIDGMPGAGKTTLAVRVAHLLAEQFPDRQLFIDLHGHTPGRAPVAPEEALAGLLAAAGVDPRFVPGDLDGRAAMWRDRMAGQRALLVLDNAASSAQVGPLLPGGQCLVLVTSRRHLGDLPGAVTPVLLDVLTPAQAARMFIRLAPRAADRPGEVAEVVALAGFLPLAVSLLARLFARHGSWTLADLAAETRASLLTLTAEHDSVAAAFEVSYGHLDPAQQRFFCLLGLHPGTTIEPYAAAALAGTGLADAAALLDALHGEGLLTEISHRRYGLHDLLRRYARDHAAGLSGSEQAVERLLDYYQHTAARADTLIGFYTQSAPPPAAPAGLPAAPDLQDTAQALAWVRAERASLISCLDHVTRAGQHARVIALTAGIAGLLHRDGPWADAIARHAAAVQAAQCAGDRRGQANALTYLGDAQRLAGDYLSAAQAQEQALSIYRDLGSRLGQANALTYLGSVRRAMADYPAATEAHEQALSIYRDLGSRLGQANALNELAETRNHRDDYPGAAQAQEQALSIYRDLGSRLGQANALNELGDMRRATGDYPAATEALQQALSIARELDDRRGQVIALNYLGDVRRLTGDYPAATEALQQALSIARELDDRRGQANALNHLGNLRLRTGDYPGAAQAQEQALSIYRDLGDRRGQAHALNDRAAVHQASGDPTRAEACYQQALELARAMARLWDEAHALAGLGRCAMANDAARAEALLRQALEIFQQIGAAEAPGVLAEVNSFTSKAQQDEP
jgi:tetratricopeptide (TPR) repeat protein